MTKKTKPDARDAQIAELTTDLQRLRADFENYRKRVDGEKQTARNDGEVRAIKQLLPIIDTIERATFHIPDDIAEHQWVKGVAGLVKQLDKMLLELDLKRIDAKASQPFNPEVHQAVQFDESAEGEHEVIAEELQPGYILHGTPIRHSMVRVTRK